MKLNRKALLSALKGRILLPEAEYEMIADIAEDSQASYSEKITRAEPVEGSVNEVTTEGIERGYWNSNDEWRAMALEVVRQTCLEKPRFTVNDFRDRLEASGHQTHDKRAVGGIMRAAKAMKWCRTSGNVIESKVGHKSSLQIWESFLHPFYMKIHA